MGPSAGVDGQYFIVNGRRYDFGSAPTLDFNITQQRGGWWRVEVKLENNDQVVILSTGLVSIRHPDGDLERGRAIDFFRGGVRS